ncbi:hypothetical protein SAMN04488128_103704 [Chitinophaga eiseniae]|uniref:Uncharacterized protein n=1 Tax=Chitinophaga eiseniae TaxID=634771 RepID=A0A1T4SXQ4_9BACT|nr:S24 family peptidase [Chitinophaga eiseniae]SKA32698.1 hypothetical protein SAMN04488128_103704 [Chitinophaga eiseniae]
MFPITGDSMLPIPSGSDVVCSYVQNWAQIKPKTLCIVILRAEQNIVFKQVTLQPEGLLLESLNSQFLPYTVPVSEVHELWEFYSFHSRDIPEADTDLQSIASIMRQMQIDINELKKKK